MTKTKAILLIAVVVFLSFGNSLFHDFIGDDRALFVQNAFYHHPQNLKKVFQKSFIMASSDIPLLPSEEISFSGCLSYRPITALTFFADYSLWGKNPFGHHLTNVFLHLAATVALFYFVFLLSGKQNLALLAALLFAAHPIQSEVVNGVGYRSDILAALFYLLTLIAHIKNNRRQDKKSPLLSAGAYVSFFIALFSKESALTLPAILFVYDVLFEKRAGWGTFIRERAKRYAGFVLVCGFYVYIYFFVMANPFYPNLSPLGNTRWEQFLIALKIFYMYLTVLVLPFKITILPPLYAPLIEEVKLYEIFLASGAILAAIGLGVRFLKKNALVSFCFLWFLLNYLPVSNVMPLPNPLAFRFMYLPSVGFFIGAALLLERGINYLQERSPSLHVGAYIKIMVIGLLISFTIPNNVYFCNNIFACKAMIRNYPLSSRPYWILGLSYFEENRYEEAIGFFKKYLETQRRNKFIKDVQEDALAYHALGKCYVDSPDTAIVYFKKALSLRPELVAVYIDVAKAYMMKGDYEQSLVWAQEAIQRQNNFVVAYVYAAHSCIELGKMEEAQRFLKRAIELAPNDENVRYVKIFYDQRREK